MHQLTRRLPLKTTALILIALLFAPYATMAQGNRPGDGLTVPITGTFTDALGGMGRFVGTLDIQRFIVQNGQLAAVGTLVKQAKRPGA